MTLLIALTMWLNALAILLLFTSALSVELPSIPDKGSRLFLVIAVLWGSALLIHVLLGKRWTYINESRKYLRYLGDRRQMYVSLVVVWLLFTYTAFFPLSMYLYGVH